MCYIDIIFRARCLTLGAVCGVWLKLFDLSLAPPLGCLYWTVWCVYMSGSLSATDLLASAQAAQQELASQTAGGGAGSASLVAQSTAPSSDVATVTSRGRGRGRGRGCGTRALIDDAADVVGVAPASQHAPQCAVRRRPASAIVAGELVLSARRANPRACAEEPLSDERHTTPENVRQFFSPPSSVKSKPRNH